MQRKQTRKKCRCVEAVCKHLKNVTKPGPVEPKAEFCDATTCSDSSTQWATTKTLYTKFQETRQYKNNTSDLENSDFLESILPQDVYDALVNASKKGSLLAFLCTLTEEVVTDLLRPRGVSEDCIYWINQAFKALILITAGLSIGKTLAAPIVNFLLVKALSCSKTKASCFTIAGVIGFELWSNPMTLPKVITMSGAAVSSLTTSICTHFGYSKVKDNLCGNKSEIEIAKLKVG